jgi:SAM-dependent methyltransferase
MKKLGLTRKVKVGDHVKSWDVLKTLNFIEENIPKDAPILDIGAYASEIPLILHRLNYTDLTGVDLNPKINDMPHAERIQYVVSDFTQTSFEDESYRVITAISVIEHGFNSHKLLAEISRLLCNGGCFIASFDYWPDKINTSDTPIFGMDWRIFSRGEVLNFIDEAGNYGLTPHGAIDLKAQDRTVHHAGRDYTFAWLALIKTSANNAGSAESPLTL